MATGNQVSDSGLSAGVIGLSPASRPPSSPALDPIGQVASQDRPWLQEATIPPAGIVEIVGENVNRIALYAQARDGSDFVLTPDPSATFSPPGGPGTARTPQVIHSAVYPVLCQGRWFVAGNPGVVVAYWESLKAG